MSVEDLRARVAAEYAELDLPTWANPHPDGAAPLDEEYSRVTDPDRYRIVHARARAWTAVLEELAGARAEPWLAGGDETARVTRGVRLTSPRPGTLPLLLLEGTGSPTSLLTCAIDPSWPLDQQPDCGCDACDWGSASLLEAIDDKVAAFVGGPYVLMRGDGWHAAWHPDGGEAGGTAMDWDFGHLMDLSRRLAAGEAVDVPDGAEVAVNRSWLG